MKTKEDIFNNLVVYDDVAGRLYYVVDVLVDIRDILNKIEQHMRK